MERLKKKRGIQKHLVLYQKCKSVDFIKTLKMEEKLKEAVRMKENPFQRAFSRPGIRLLYY
jgi:hypothetical protein